MENSVLSNAQLRFFVSLRFVAAFPTKPMHPIMISVVLTLQSVIMAAYVGT